MVGLAFTAAELFPRNVEGDFPDRGGNKRDFVEKLNMYLLGNSVGPEIMEPNTEGADDLMAMSGGEAMPLAVESGNSDGDDDDNCDFELAGMTRPIKVSDRTAVTNQPRSDALADVTPQSAVPGKAKEAPSEIVTLIRQINDQAVLDAVSEVIKQQAQDLAAIKDADIARLMAQIEAMGLKEELAKVLGSAQQPGAPKRKAKPLYRLPSGDTWSGRGKMKRSFQAAIDLGHQLEEFRI